MVRLDGYYSSGMCRQDPNVMILHKKNIADILSGFLQVMECERVDHKCIAEKYMYLHGGGC